MKKVILGLVVLLVFGFVGCASTGGGEPKPTKFEGTWEGRTADYVFTNNQFQLIRSEGTLSGSFTFTSGKITFNGADGQSFTLPYEMPTNSFAGSCIRINDANGVPTKSTGFFIKKVEPTKFEGVWSLEGANYIFSRNGFMLFREGSQMLTGTFTFNDTRITFKKTNGEGGIWSQQYTLDNNTLTLGSSVGMSVANSAGAFTKRTQPTIFEGAWKRTDGSADIVFTNNQYRLIDNTNGLEEVGMFAYTDKEFAHFSNTKGRTSAGRAPYTINGSTFTRAGDTTYKGAGEFEKQ